MGLDDALADGQAQAGPAELASPLVAVELGELAEQVGQLLDGQAHAVVGHREGDVDAVAHGGDPDGGEVVGVAGGVGEQVVQHLDDAPAVGGDPGQARRQVDDQVGSSAPALEAAPGLVHQRGDLHGFWGDRQGAGLDAGHVQQVADQVAHALRLVADDAEELGHLGGVQLGGVLQQGVGRPLDGGQRGPELVADHAQELGAPPLQVLQRRQVLDGDDHRLDHRLDLVPRGEDGRGVDQGGDALSARGLEEDLLGVHGLPGHQPLGQGELLQGDLPPVGPPEGERLQELLRGPVRRAQAADDASGLPVDRRHASGSGVQDQDAHGRGVHQGFQVGPSPLLVAVAARVGDDQGGLGGEHHQGLLVLGGELDLLLAHVDAPDTLPPVAERRGQEGQGRAHRHGRAELGQAQLSDVAVEVRQPQRFADAAEPLEEEHPVGKLGELAALLGGQPGVEEVLDAARVVQEGDDAVAGAGQGAGAVQDPLEHVVEVQALADAQAGRAEAGQPLPQGLVFFTQLPGIFHAHDLYSSRDGPPFPGAPGRSGPRRLIVAGMRQITQGKTGGRLGAKIPGIILTLYSIFCNTVLQLAQPPAGRHSLGIRQADRRSGDRSRNGGWPLHAQPGQLPIFV